MSSPGISGFVEQAVATEWGSVFVRRGGSGPPVLLLHGFPETGSMWHAIAPLLASDLTVIVADLPGYGRSACPADSDDHSAMSKRALARTLVAAMGVLGHKTFAIVGHDRGGRVAYRAALDHPAVITKVAVLDVVPTEEVWERADARLTLAFWPFSLLAQPAPLPERLIAGDPAAVIDNALSKWGSPENAFPDWLRAEYVAALSDPTHIHAICEEYRAAATIDREHDHADHANGRRISSPLLALWSASGGLATWYQDAGGPLGLWRRWANDVQGASISGGHFFPEEKAPPRPSSSAHFSYSFQESYERCCLSRTFHCHHVRGNTPTIPPGIDTALVLRFPRAAADGSLGGFLTDMLNPKVGAFYVSFLPQFIPAGASVAATTIALTAIHALLGMAWFLALIVVTRPFARLLRGGTSVTRLDRITGVFPHHVRGTPRRKQSLSRRGRSCRASTNRIVPVAQRLNHEHRSCVAGVPIIFPPGTRCAC